MRGIGDSDDVDFDSARTIMANLHIQKVGVPFELIAIYMRQQTTRSFGIPSVYWEAGRVFMSRVNTSGLYEQWGSERKSVLAKEVGGASTGHATQIMPSTA